VDKNGYFFEYKYNPKQPQQLASITSQDQTLSLKFRWNENRITEVTDNQARRAAYSYDKSGNLAKVTDSTGQTYIYKYENKGLPHLLTQIDYPNDADPKASTSREIRYEKTGLVIFHKDRDGSETTYSYGKGSSDPENNFWTKSVKKLPNGASDEQYDEYFLKLRPDGTKYLYKQLNRQNNVETTTVYTACCGKPQQIIANGVVTNFKYYADGLLMEKTGPKESLKLEYDPRWKKVTKVAQNDFISDYTYDDRGNLVKASNSRNEKVSLSYDRQGRISKMIDASERVITFKYGANGKPAQISQKGVGTIRISYDGDGQISKTETLVAEDQGRKPSQTRSQEIIQRVMKGFQHLLDIIRPAGVSFAAI
jgi:YD repeat-containing protein